MLVSVAMQHQHDMFVVAFNNKTKQTDFTSELCVAAPFFNVAYFVVCICFVPLTKPITGGASELADSRAE